jgi:D-psicose/D-tagatose/L-ribulose 3-epimerase
MKVVSASYRYAICNELFQDMPLARVCQEVRALGYAGLELAPFTLSADPVSLSPAERTVIRQTISDHGLSFVGLHWLLAAPPGLHITARDESVRKHTWDYVRALVDLCADFTDSGKPPVVVFGSPKQRSAGGLSAQEATAVFTEEMGRLAPHAASCGVTLLVEALSSEQTEVVNTLEEAVAMVKQIDSPAVQTMFDVHNAADERLPHTDLVRKFFPYIRHIHVNEMDGREPGMGSYNFGALLNTLVSLDYSGWVSLEAFDFSRDPRDVAARAITHLKASLASPLTTRSI